MPPPRTRALWLEFEAKARWVGPPRDPTKAFVRECERFWARLSAKKREGFVNAYNDYLAYFERNWHQMNRAEGVQREANAFDPVQPGTDWPKYMAAQHEAAEAWQRTLNTRLELSAATLRLQTAVTNFRTLDRNNRTPAHAGVRAWLRQQTARGDTQRIYIMNRLNTARGKADTPPIPSNRADGRLKIRKNSVPQKLKEAHDEVRALNFRTGQPAPGAAYAGWTGAWVFGGGAMANAGLWVLIGQTGTIEDRMVRKDTFLDEWDWNDISKSWGDMRDPDAREPYEIKCHRALHSADSSFPDPSNPPGRLRLNVPMVRESHMDVPHQMYGMSLEYCPSGDLGDLIHNYHEQDPRPHLPEPFLWRVFHSLAEVGLAMRKGHARRNVPAAPTWQQIIHRDLKPSNIFLAAPQPGYFASYPTPKVADFGLSFTTTPADKLNPTSYADGSGTEGYMAPEQEAFVSLPDMRPVDRFPLLAHTNVYAAGMVMLSLIDLTNEPMHPNFVGNGEEAGNFPVVAATAGYSAQLTALVQDCIRFQPANRPTWEQILHRIDQAMDENGLDLARDLRTTAAVDETDADFLQHVPEDAYPLGLTNAELPEL